MVLLKKIFKVRQCTNSFYRSRSRPCLEYQIGLCSAPCVGKVSDVKYAQDVEMVNLFLNGKSSRLLSKISQKMKQASIDLDFEAAANYRDQLIGLRTSTRAGMAPSLFQIWMLLVLHRRVKYSLY